MATRLYTNFLVPEDNGLEVKGVYWMDVQDDYEKVFNQLWPLQPATSSLEQREYFWYTKMDGGRFACTPGQICGIEELV